MASNVTRDHHRWTRDITVSKASPATINLTDGLNSTLIVSSDGAAAPVLELAGKSQEGTSSPILQFRTQRDTDTSGQVGDNTGVINFIGYNDASTPVTKTFVSIKSFIDVFTDGEESGKLSLQVASNDGGLEDGLVLTGGSVDAEVDVTIGNGTASLTTIAGDLDIDGDTITAAGALTLDVNGDIILDANSGITHFYDAGDTDDAFKITVQGGTGTTRLETISAAADGDLLIIADGHVEFDNCAVGFDKEATTFAAAAVTSEGDDSTDIDFRLGNKHELSLGDNIAGSGENINMIFPATSGNFLLVLTQDSAGSRTVAADAWKAYASDASLGDNTLSTAGRTIDVISIYWDADNQTALAMASLGFATP